jgi:hypothetical protein
MFGALEEAPTIFPSCYSRSPVKCLEARRSL